VASEGLLVAALVDDGSDVWVPVIQSTSCDLRILVDQPAESIPPYDPFSRVGVRKSVMGAELRIRRRGNPATMIGP
jgi:hypothetical protein